MSKPANHKQPDLSRFSSRSMVIPSSRQDFEMILWDWMKVIVANTDNPPDNKGAGRAMKLVGTASDSIDVIMHAPPNMTLPSGGRGAQRTVFAQFLWGRLADGRWFVRAVSFSVSMMQKDYVAAERGALKEKLLEKAEQEYASRYHPRPLVFRAEDHIASWTDDIHAGDSMIPDVIDRAYEHAKKDAVLIENPVGAKDMALDMVGAGVTSVGVGTAKAYADAYDTVNTSITAHDAANRYRTGDQSTGDKVMYTTLDALSVIPGAGSFVKTMAGMFFEIAVANDVGRVTKIRSRAYIFYVAGYIQALTTLTTAAPKTNFDTKYFNLGTLMAPQLFTKQAFQVQASLLHFASEHYTAGGWGGLAYIGHKPRAWTFPDQYIVNWGPDLLGAALVTQLAKFKYLSQ